MRGKRIRYVPSISAVVILTLCAVACATSSGETLSREIAIESAGTVSRAESSPSHEPTASPATRGLQIVSDPDGAEVYINNDFKGTTPLVIETLDKGSYRLVLHKDGYYDVAEWIDFPGSYMLVRLSLQRMLGFMLLSVNPGNATVNVGGTDYVPGLIQLPTGVYAIVVRAFGYEPYKAMITILPQIVVNLDVALVPAVFSISRLYEPKRVQNPENPGALGRLEMSFDVTGPGAGEVTVSDSGYNVVFHETLRDFKTWHQSFAWDLRGSSGAALPDGEYHLMLAGVGAGGGAADSREFDFTIDRSVRSAIRSSWSGSSGLLYAPVSETLPEGSSQFSFLCAAYGDGSVFRVPFQLSARFGIGAFEVDGEAGLILSPSAAPFSLGLSGRWGIVPPSLPFGAGVAAEARVALQFNPAVGFLTTDTFTNFSGVSLGVPLQLSLGPLSLLAEPEIIASLWHPNDAAIPPALGFDSWLYLRAGILLDFGSVTGGISASVRTLSLPDGIFFYGLPLQAALEIHWLIPGTHAIVSANCIGVFDSISEYYFMVGGGLSLIY
jgi:hypothetical protein